MTCRPPTSEDLREITKYDIELLPGGFWVERPNCLENKIQCEAYLSDSAVAEIQEKCSPAIYDIDNDGYGEQIFNYCPEDKKIQYIDVDTDGRFKVKCAKLKEGFLFSLPLPALPSISLPLPNLSGIFSMPLILILIILVILILLKG